jgi:hypothetical protein
MIYPEEFKQKCREIYPNWNCLHEQLNSGTMIVGRYLDDAQQSDISATMVLKATSLEQLRAEASRIIKRQELYGEWWDLYNNHVCTSSV